MAGYDCELVAELVGKARDSSLTNTARGRALEELTCYLFLAIPGTNHQRTNTFDAHNSQEIDLAFWNAGHPEGLAGFDQIVLVECKNWSAPVGSMEVAWFDWKIRLSGRSLGVLISLSGITGSPHSLRSAQRIVSAALLDGRQILVIDANELVMLRTTGDLVSLLQAKAVDLCLGNGIMA